MIRRRLVVAFSALLLVVVGIVGLAAILAVTQTDWGRAHIRTLALAELRRVVHGSVYVGRIEGTLFTGITIDSVELRDPTGHIFFAARRVHAEYDPRDLADRRILFQRLELDRPYVRLVHHHDGTWNFQHIFPPSRRLPEPQARGFGDFIVATNVAIHGGDFYYSNRWSPEDSLPGPRRDSAVREGLRRPHYGLVREPEGLMRTFSWTGLELESPYARIVDPDSVGVAVQISRLDADEFFPPFRIARARGRVTIAHDTLRAVLPHVELPGSVLQAEGKVAVGSGRPPIYTLHFTSDSMALADIAWVYPNLPRTGGGRAVIDILTDHANPDITDFAVHDMDLRSTASRLRGDMTFETGRPGLVIKNVALEAAPVDFALIRVLGGGKPFPVPWAGQWTGRVRGPGGPLTRWRVDSADLTLHDAHVPGATTRLAGAGELDVSDPALLAFHHFRLWVPRLDLRTPQAVLPEFPRLHGVVSGVATVDSVWNDVRFADADVTHTDGGAVPERITGDGRFTLADSVARYDMSLSAQPISFTTLARSYPSLPLRGEFSGPVTLQGTLGDLDVTAQLNGAPGAFAVDGHVDATSPGLSASGALILSEVDAQAILGNDSLPQTGLTGRIDIDLRGDSLPALNGAITGTLARSSIGRVRLDTGRFVGRFGDARLRVDSLSVESRGGLLTGSGGLALAPELRDSLALAFTTDSLGGWRRYLVGESAPDSTHPDPLAGAIRVTAALTGSIDSLAASGAIGGNGVRVGGLTVRGLTGAFTLPRIRGPLLGDASLTLDGATVSAPSTVAFDRITVGAEFRGPAPTALGLTVTTSTGPHATAAATLARSPGALHLALDTLDVITSQDAWHLAAPAHFTRDTAGIALDSLVMHGVAGTVAARALVPDAGAISATFTGDSVALADVGELLQSPATYAGRAGWQMTVGGDRARPTMTLDTRLDSAEFGDVRLEELLVHGAYDARRLLVHGDLVQRHDTTLHALVSVPMDLALARGVPRLLDDSLRGSVRADSVGFAAFATIYPTLQNPRGVFQAHIDIGGTPRHPTLNGDVRLTDGEAGFPRLGVRFIGMHADLHLTGDSLAVRDLTIGSLEGQTHGRATLRGWLTFADLDDPRFDLTLAATDIHAMSNPRVADVALSTEPGAPLHLVGQLSAAHVSGAAVVDRGTIFLPDILTQKKVVSLDDPSFYDLVDTSQFVNRSLLSAAPPRLLQHLSLEGVRIALGNDVWLRSSEANINLTTAAAPLVVTTAPTGRDSTRGLALSGTLIAARGTYRLNLGIVQRSFTVDTGSVRFTGTTNIDPDLDIHARYVVRQPPSTATGSVSAEVPIEIILFGPLSDPKVRLTSPDSLLSLSQSDLLSYLITGQQSFAVGQGTPGGTGAQVANFVLPTLGTAISSRLSGGWLDYVNVQTGAGYDPSGTQNGFATALSATRIGAGKQLGRSTFLSADLGVCTLAGNGAGTGTAGATASQIGVRLEQQLTRSFSLAASSEPGTSGIYCTEGALSRSFVTTPRQWGLDLFHTWQF